MIIILEDADLKSTAIVRAALTDFSIGSQKTYCARTVVYFPPEGGVNVFKNREMPHTIYQCLPDKISDMLKEILAKDAIAKL